MLLLVGHQAEIIQRAYDLIMIHEHQLLWLSITWPISTSATASLFIDLNVVYCIVVCFNGANKNNKKAVLFRAPMYRAHCAVIFAIELLSQR